jgi:hypothetical protein
MLPLRPECLDSLETREERHNILECFYERIALDAMQTALLFIERECEEHS